MKKMMLILAMLLIAATSYNQTSRRSTNERTTANKPVTRETRTTSERTTGNNKATVTRSTQTTTHPSSRATNPGTTSTTRTRTVTPHDNDDGRSRPAQTSTPTRTRENTNSNTTRSHSTVNRTTETRPSGTRTTTTHTDRTRTTSTTPSREVVKVSPDRRTQPARTVEYHSPRVYRSQHTVRHTSHRAPQSVEYRRTHYSYRRPAHIQVYWTPVMHRHYIDIYPMVRHWHYHNGYRIENISAYDAMYYRGEVATVYGRVKEVFYSHETDEYFLYYGVYYPHQDFTVVLPGYIARKFNHRPERFFTNRYLAITGLITSFNGDPEIVVKREFQINLY